MRFSPSGDKHFRVIRSFGSKEIGVAGARPVAYLEGIAIFRTRPKAVYAGFEEEGIKDPAIQKDIYERMLKNMREYPVPEPNGIQNVLDSLTNPNARNVKPASIMDTSLMEEIKKSGFIDKLYGRAS